MTLLLEALLGVVVLAVIFFVLFAWADDLGFLVPRSARGINPAAESFCTSKCRMADGRCRLTASNERAVDCPLFKFVESDSRLAVYGSPFAA